MRLLSDRCFVEENEKQAYTGGAVRLWSCWGRQVARRPV